MIKGRIRDIALVTAAVVATVLGGAGVASAAPGPTLSRYYDGAAAAHWATIGQPPAGFTLDGQLVGLLTHHHGLVGLYACQTADVGNFLSTDAHCEGQTFLGLQGYLSPTATATASVALYRCSSATLHDHLETTDPPVNGRCGEDPSQYSLDGLLGYGIPVGPGSDLPESPFAVALPLAGVAVIAGVVVLGRRRSRRAA